MKRALEEMSNESILQVLGSNDLLGIIVRMGRLSPTDLIHLMSTSKFAMQACQSNSIWHYFVGGLPRPSSQGDETYRIYQNLALGKFILDDSFPSASFPKYREYARIDLPYC
jgi:hypothetical protein